MAKIVTLKDNIANESVYPQTKAEAVYNTDGDPISTTLEGLTETDSTLKVMDGYGLPLSSMQTFYGWPTDEGWHMATGASHRVIPISGGDKLSMTAASGGDAVYVWLVKSYQPPKSASDEMDVATGETGGHRVSTALVELTAPSDAKFAIVGCELGGGEHTITKFKVNDFNILTGTREPVVDTLESYQVVLEGKQGEYIETPGFLLHAGRTYRIHFSSDEFRVLGGDYLWISYGNSYLTGVNDVGEEYIMSFSSPESGVISLPDDCLFTPQFDEHLLIRTRLNKVTCLKITITEIKCNLLSLVNSSNKLLQDGENLRSIMVENMLTGGKFIGDPNATQTYMQSHVEIDGEFFVAAFVSKTMKSESDPNDSAGGLIYFNASNPEKTTEFIPALSPGDIIFEGQGTRCDKVSYCIDGLVNPSTIRVIMYTVNKAVYKDFDLTTRTFETYCHLCKFNIDGTIYDAVRENSQTIQEALNLTKYFDGSNLLSFSGNPISVNGYWYTGWNFYGWSHAMCRTEDFETWEFVSEFPYPYLSDEFQLCYAYNRIYATCTGNIDRRPNGYYSAIMYFNLSNSTWSAIKYLEEYGHDACAMVALEGDIYVMHQRLHWRAPNNEQMVRYDTFVNNFKLPRSNKTIFVYDKSLNEISHTNLYLRRAAVTCQFSVHGGNLYALIGTNPRGLVGDGRQNAMFSYIDIRLLK